jgi:hypothetical protein
MYELFQICNKLDYLYTFRWQNCLKYKKKQNNPKLDRRHDLEPCVGFSRAGRIGGGQGEDDGQVNIPKEQFRIQFDV